MASAYFHSGMKDIVGEFEMYVRKLPNNRNYLVICGLEQIVSYLMNFKFTKTQIDFLKRNKMFKKDEKFLEYLKGFRFTGDLWAVSEGTVLFPNEPFLRIEAPIIQASSIVAEAISRVEHHLLRCKPECDRNLSSLENQIPVSLELPKWEQMALRKRL